MVEDLRTKTGRPNPPKKMVDSTFKLVLNPLFVEVCPPVPNGYVRAGKPTLLFVDQNAINQRTSACRIQ